jgi:hypothetical protein
MRAVKYHAPIRPRDKMDLSGAIDFTRLVAHDIIFDKRVFGIFKHALRNLNFDPPRMREFS